MKKTSLPPLDEHLRDFATAWKGMREKIKAEFSVEERQKFDALNTEHQRDGFVVVRAFDGLAKLQGNNDFQVSRASLADRLSLTPPGAGDVIKKLCKEVIITQTQPCVVHRESARYRWLLPQHADAQITAISCE